MFQTFLLELAKVLQFQTLTPDEKGACTIIMREKGTPLVFDFDDQLVPNTILLSSLLGPLPLTHHREIYEALLMGNSSQEETLSIKPDEPLLYLHRRLHPAIQSDELEPLLDQFLKQVEIWKEKITQITQSPAKVPSHPSAIQVFPYKA